MGGTHSVFLAVTAKFVTCSFKAFNKTKPCLVWCLFAVCVYLWLCLLHSSRFVSPLKLAVVYKKHLKYLENLNVLQDFTLKLSLKLHFALLNFWGSHTSMFSLTRKRTALNGELLWLKIIKCVFWLSGLFSLRENHIFLLTACICMLVFKVSQRETGVLIHS